MLQVTFIMGQLKQHVEAGKLLDELQAVLDEEAAGLCAEAVPQRDL